MNPAVIVPPRAVPVDKDLAEQAKPGHGVPSQDPDPAAQSPMEPGEAEREANSVLTGRGVMVGAAIGTAVAGSVGAMVGGTVGAVAGALGGAAAGTAMNPGDPSADPVPASRAPEARGRAATAKSVKP